METKLVSVMLLLTVTIISVIHIYIVTMLCLQYA